MKIAMNYATHYDCVLILFACRFISSIFFIGLFAPASHIQSFQHGNKLNKLSKCNVRFHPLFEQKEKLLGQQQSTTTTEPSSSSSLSYGDTDGASKGIVSSLTSLVNTISRRVNSNSLNNESIDAIVKDSTDTSTTSFLLLPPKSPEELLERIRNDYVENNYLWTGNLDISCFQKQCRFTDPTISFVGTSKFVENTQNLVPLVNASVDNSRSKLLYIKLVSNKEDSSYIETRWNMIGSLSKSPILFWKPKIDVIGRTKFWFTKTVLLEDPEQSSTTPANDYYYQVYFYDEEWEIPAYQALLQLITPGSRGTSE